MSNVIENFINTCMGGICLIIAIMAFANYMEQKLKEQNNASTYTNQVAKQGNLCMLKLLYENGFVCSQQGADNAAEAGHLNVVKWLHENNIKCTQQGMRQAIINNHCDVVEFLLQANIYPCSRNSEIPPDKVERWINFLENKFTHPVSLEE